MRDQLLNIPSTEIDIATSASPKQVQALFPKTIPVGIAFGVIIVVLKGINFEVATFRKDHPYHDGRHPDGVDFSSPKKDAERRDFTINGMFYDPLTDEIHDFVNGKQDLKARILRAIGNPAQRFTEDRLRMIRAVRFATRFGFRIEEKTAEAIQNQASTLFPAVSMERIWQEFCKMSTHPRFDLALIMLHRFGLLQTIFPELDDDIEKRVALFPYFPPQTPTIVYLAELIPSPDLGHYLKVSNKEQQLLEFFLQKEPQTLTAWAHFYAHPHTELWEAVQTAKILPPEKTSFHESHKKRRLRLERHIERIKSQKPLVTAAHLQKLGIKPSQEMGQLLKKAEEIAIENDLHSAQEVISRLELPHS